MKAAKTQKKQVTKTPVHPLVEATPRNFRIGGDVLPKRDLTRYVRYPKYIQHQRQKSVLLNRLKVPPTVNQFNNALDKNNAVQLLKLLNKYKPETRSEKTARINSEAQAQAEGKAVENKKPTVLKYGLNHITELIENKLAKLVVISHDVDPIELVAWLPALCKKKDVPFCIIKGKGRLGALVNKKNASAVALTSVRKEDVAELETLSTTVRGLFNEKRAAFGGQKLGFRSFQKAKKIQASIDAENIKKASVMA